MRDTGVVGEDKRQVKRIERRKTDIRMTARHKNKRQGQRERHPGVQVLVY